MLYLLLCALLCTPVWAARFITTSPQTTELIFQLGLGDQVVGVSAGSHYPSEAKSRPSIGELFAPSLEKTIALRPNCVVLDTHNINEPYARALRSRGIQTFLWNTFSPQSLLADARKFVAAFAESRGEAKLKQWERCLDSIPPSAPKSFIGFVWLDPPILMGPTSFLSRLLEKFGYHNALSSRFRAPYLAVTEEWLVTAKVDTIFYLAMSEENSELSAKKFRHWWPRGNGRTVRLDGETFARASLTPFEHLAKLFQSLPEACHAP